MAKPKLRDIFQIIKTGVGIGKVFAPPGVGKVLDVVTKGLDEEDTSTSLPDALKQMAAINDEQTEALYVLHKRLADVEAKLAKEKK